MLTHTRSDLYRPVATSFDLSRTATRGVLTTTARAREVVR